MHTNIFSFKSNKYFIILIQLIHSICDNHLRKDDLMNYTVTNLRHLRIAQISLLTYYIYLAFHDNIFKAIPLLFISGILDSVYPPDYANQSFCFPYKK